MQAQNNGKTVHGEVSEGAPKKYYCATKHLCQFKQHYINQRCFAPYAVRQSCPSLTRADGLSILQGSKQESPLVK